MVIIIRAAETSTICPQNTHVSNTANYLKDCGVNNPAAPVPCENAPWYALYIESNAANCEPLNPDAEPPPANRSVATVAAAAAPLYG
jgi:hypothetical protein